MRKHPLWLASSGINLVVVGLSSFIFHSSQTKVGRILDHIAPFIYLINLFIYQVFDTLDYIGAIDAGIEKISDLIAVLAFLGTNFFIWQWALDKEN